MSVNDLSESSGLYRDLDFILVKKKIRSKTNHNKKVQLKQNLSLIKSLRKQPHMSRIEMNMNGVRSKMRVDECTS